MWLFDHVDYDKNLEGRIYATTVVWMPPASVSMGWFPYPRIDAEAFLRIAIGDALSTTSSIP